MTLFLSLLVSAVVALFIAGLISSNRKLFGFTKRAQAQKQFSLLAEGAINRLIQHWVANPAFQGDLTHNDGDLFYRITFNTGDPDYSVNNLGSSGVAGTSNFRGDPVPPATADVVVVCGNGRLNSRYRFLLRRGQAALEAVGTNGRMVFEDDVVLDSIASLANPTNVRARFHSNDGNGSGTGVDWNNSGSFQVMGQVELSSSTTIAPGIVGSNPGSTLENEPRVALPTLDVDSLVTQASGAGPPQTLAGGGRFVTGQCYLSGNQIFSNDITLSDGTLYVQGDLEVNGGISGTGAVYVTGDVTVKGGNAAVLTNQPSGAALIAGGDVNFEGLDAYTFLLNAAASRPAVQTALNNTITGLQILNDVHSQPTAGYVSPASFAANMNPLPSLGSGNWTGHQKEAEFWFAHSRLSRGTSSTSEQGSPPEIGNQPISIPGPDGSFAIWNTGSPLRQLKDALATEFPGNPQADQIGRGLDELAYYFRTGWNATTTTWDDIGLPPPSWSIERANFSLVWANPHQFSPESDGHWFGNRQAYSDAITTFFSQNDPLDLSWLGKASFQGLVMSNGDIVLENDAVIIGSVYADGDLTMRGGATLVYNAEYDDLTNLINGPIQVFNFEEI